MNWLDIVIVAMWSIGFFAGWKIGLFGAIFTTGGLIVGVLLAGRFSDNVADFLTDSISNDTMATIIAYGIILLAVFVVAQVLKAVVKGFMKMVFLGWVDTVGSLTLGLVMGIVLSTTLITVTARYSSDIPLSLLDLAPENVISNLPVEFLIERSGIQEKLNKSMIESSLIPIFLDIRGTLPGQSLGFIPDDFNIALDVLETQINSQYSTAP